MSRWDKYDTCHMCAAPTGTRCWVVRRAPGVPWTPIVTDMPAAKKHPGRPLLPKAGA